LLGIQSNKPTISEKLKRDARRRNNRCFILNPFRKLTALRGTVRITVKIRQPIQTSIPFTLSSTPQTPGP
jgi:hypothetical protein